uniref:DEAD/DEAH box helicase n=1 Tax=Enterococcus malodoratus TaxID=71451 RepID=UPI002073E166
SLASYLYAPQLNISIESDEIIQSDEDLKKIFQVNCEPLTTELYDAIFSVIDYSGGMFKPKQRDISAGEENTKGSILNRLEKEIATFDNEQKYAALSDLNGPQRIRGLAGSGKTVILCMKAAALHLRYPEKKILYTFMTKSLYDYIEVLITRFYKLMGDGSLPDFEDSILIRHSWGGGNLGGVYYDACRESSIIPLNFSQARKQAGNEDVFDYICRDLLSKTKGNLHSKYDYVLIDEAQDFRASFYQICRELTVDDNLVWGYDNLQNIYDVEIQDTMKTFENEYGAKGIDLVKLRKNHPEMNNDIVLPKSYRNAKEVLITAHAIGFGIYNDELIQRFENNKHWEDLGYEVNQGESKLGDKMIISRPSKNSPLSISCSQTFDDLISFYSAKDMEDEVNWVVEEIYEEITQQKLKPEDIVVISLDDRFAKQYLKKVAESLDKMGIHSYNLSDDYYSKGFIIEDAVTLSTVYKAKGNEAGFVFVIGCDVFDDYKDDIKMRNRVFTAFTRSKGWLRISGIGIEDSKLVDEIRKVQENNLKMIFEYKDTKARVIKRDRTDKTSLDIELEKAMSKIIEKGVTPEQYRKRFESNEKR